MKISLLLFSHYRFLIALLVESKLEYTQFLKAALEKDFCVKGYYLLKLKVRELNDHIGNNLFYKK